MYVGFEKINKLICGAGAWLDEPARGIEMGEQEKGGGGLMIPPLLHLPFLLLGI
jgi:hypothetical protein